MKTQTCERSDRRPADTVVRSHTDEADTRAEHHPAAIAFETPSQRRLIERVTRKGAAPRPVARAVTKAAAKTVQTLTSMQARAPRG